MLDDDDIAHRAWLPGHFSHGVHFRCLMPRRVLRDAPPGFFDIGGESTRYDCRHLRCHDGGVSFAHGQYAALRNTEAARPSSITFSGRCHYAIHTTTFGRLRIGQGPCRRYTASSLI